MMDGLSLIIDGYDDAPREIYSIQELRRFYLRLLGSRTHVKMVLQSGCRS